MDKKYYICKKEYKTVNFDDGLVKDFTVKVGETFCIREEGSLGLVYLRATNKDYDEGYYLNVPEEKFEEYFEKVKNKKLLFK